MKNPLLPFLASLCLFCLLVASAPAVQASGGVRYRTGTVAARGIVYTAAGNPIWVEYDEQGDVVATIGEAAGNLAGSYVLPAATVLALIDSYNQIKDQYRSNHELLSSEEYQAREFTDAVGQPIAKPPLQASSRSVAVRKANILYRAADLILHESPLDLKRPQTVPTGARAVLLGQDGRLLHTAAGNIGYRVAFYTPPDGNILADQADMDADGNSDLYNLNRHEDRVWAPIAGARIESSLDLGRHPAYTDASGFYTVSHTLPPCPGFSMEYDNAIYAQIWYATFNPKARNLGMYYAVTPDWDMCFGYGEVALGLDFVSQGVSEYVAGLDQIGQSQVSVLSGRDITIDVAMLTGQADLRNLDGEIIPQATATEYAFQVADFAPLVPETDLDGDGRTDRTFLATDGTVKIWLGAADPDKVEPDLVHRVDRQPDFTHQGLLKQISHDDLLDTDMYVYRVSNGVLFSSREGLAANETSDPALGGADNRTDSGINYLQMIRGAVRTPAIRQLEKWVSSARVNPDLEGREADRLRPGEPIKVIMINRASGYIGTESVDFSKNEAGGPISFSPARIEMQAPNLKISVARKHLVEAGLSKGKEYTNLIGFEGSGLTSDQVITITTEWFQQDGSPLPPDLPGYTGRLAKVVAPGVLGQGSSRVANFPIQPGRHTVVVHLPQAEIDRAHYYIHVSGEPPEGSPNFSSLGAGDGPLAYRPSHYVPVRIPLYDEVSTLEARRLRQAAGGDRPAPEPVYQWVYRPEMQFSLFDLLLQGRDDVTNPGDDADPDLIPVVDTTSPNAAKPLENYQELFYRILADDEVARPLLPAFGPERELVFNLGGQEITASIQGAGLPLVFENLNPARLNPAALLTLQLYQNGDDNNLLWEYGLDVAIVNIDYDKEPKPTNERDKDVIRVGERAMMKVVTRPENRSVTWSVAEAKEGVNVSLDPDTGRLEVLEGTPASSKVTVRATDKVFPFLFQDRVLTVGCDCKPCQTSGTCKMGLDSIDLEFGLGSTDNGRSAGKLYIAAKEVSKWLAHPASLRLSSAFSGTDAVQVVSSSDLGLIEQVLTLQSLAVVRMLSEYQYEIAFYPASAVSGTTVEIDQQGNKTKTFTVNSSIEPIVVWRLENPDGAGNKNLAEAARKYNRLQVSEIRAGQSQPSLNEYVFDQARKQWSLSQDNGKQIEELLESTDASGRAVRERIHKDEQGRIASHSRSTYQTYPWGEMLVEEVNDPEHEALTVSQDYYADPAVAGSYRRLKSRIEADGSWNRYEYDDQGRQSRLIQSYLDADLNGPASQARETIFDYTPLTPEDDNDSTFQKQPRTVTEKILGQVVARSYYSYATDDVSNDRLEIVEQAASPDASFGASGNLRTVTLYYPDNRLKQQQAADGRKTTYFYSTGTYDPATRIFTPGAGTDRQESVIHGSSAHEYGLPLQSTKEVTISDRLDQSLLQESYALTETGFARLDWTAFVLDDFGRAKETHYANGTMSTADWGCCGKTRSSTDINGLSTTSFYDSLERLQRRERQGPNGLIVSSYTYDGAGRQLTETVTSGGLSQSTSQVYDSSGRLLSSQDAAHLQTTYSYENNGRTSIVTRPGGATEISSGYPDGTLRSVTGSGVVPRYYEYGINADGSRWTLVRTGGPSSPRWEKTFTDLLGRTIRMEKPGPAGLEITENFYNDKGQLERTTTSGQTDTLFVYDELGNQVRSGLDVDGNGELQDASVDRISQSETLYKNIDNDWWQENTGIVFAPATENDSGARVSSIQRSRVTGLGDNGLTTENQSQDMHGNLVVSRTYIDRETATVRQIIDYPDTGIDAETETVKGFLKSSRDKTGLKMEYAYDDLGRQTGIIDPRTGLSATHYNALGQVDYLEDAAHNRTRFAYAPTTGLKIMENDSLGQVTRYRYDSRGQLTHTWGTAAYPLKNIYDDYGQLHQMITYRGNHAWGNDTWPVATNDSARTTWHYDPATGLLTAKEDASGNAVSYTYTPGSRLKTRTWARTDDSGQPLVTTYSYNPATAELTNIDYSDATPDVAFTYDRLGRQSTITDAVGTRTFTYNATMQPESETITGLYNETITRSYETSGLKGRSSGFFLGSDQQASDYSVSYGYDPASGRFQSVSWNVLGNSETTVYTYLNDSNLVETLATGTSQLVRYAYEPQRNLKTSISNTFGDTLMSQYEYSYDASGRRQNLKKSGWVYDDDGKIGFNIFSYNSRSELTGSNSYLGEDVQDTSNPLPEENRAYNYDAIGNRTTATAWDSAQQVATELTYTANRLNQYDLIASNIQPEKSLSFDQDGNLTGIRTGTKKVRYSYDAENRLVTVAPAMPDEGGIMVEFLYDYMGRRVEKKVFTLSAEEWTPESDTFFTYDGWNLIAENKTVSNGQAKEKFYVWGLDLSQSLQGAGGIGGLLSMVDVAHESSYLYFYDGNGNVGQFVDSLTGVIAGHYEYDPYGNVVKSYGDLAGGNPFRFSTKYHDDETGLVYYGKRYYSSELGRWINRDPIAELGGINLYLFALNNPVNYIDPFGYEANSTSGILLNFAKQTGVKAYSAAWQASDTFNRAIFFPFVDLLSLPDEAIKCIFGVSDDDLLAWSAQLPGGYDDMFLGVILGAGKTPAVARKLLGYAIKEPITDPSRLLPLSRVPNATGEITSEFLEDSTIFYRAHGGDSGPIGAFLAPSKPFSRAEAISGSALPPGNTAEFVSTLRVQGEVRIQRSTAAEAFGQPGGDAQVELLGRAKIKILKTEHLE